MMQMVVHQLRRRLQRQDRPKAPPLVFLITLALLSLYLAEYGMSTVSETTIVGSPLVYGLPNCAINLFGLPRSFKSLVLPSLIKNVISQNDCDYFVHYYFQTEEVAGRSGQGGTIDPNDILLLRQAVQNHAKNKSRKVTVHFKSETEESFWKEYTPLVEKIRYTKKGDRYYYFPWKARTYKHPVTTDNIIKMWHSIQSAWDLMQEFEVKNQFEYSTVAMLRSDVVYMTPITVSAHEPPDVTIPAFGRHPISDRIIFGPHDAVRVWATERFSRLEDHVAWIYQHDPGWGLHSERFMNYTIFPRIHVPIKQHPTMCFFRARADESLWVSDCGGGAAARSIMQNLGKNIESKVEETLGRKCTGKMEQLTSNFRSLSCPLSPSAS